MSYIISIKVDHPRYYDSSTNRKLENLEIKKIITKNVARQIYDKLEEHPEAIAPKGANYGWSF